MIENPEILSYERERIQENQRVAEFEALNRTVSEFDFLSVQPLMS